MKLLGGSGACCTKAWSQVRPISLQTVGRGRQSEGAEWSACLPGPAGWCPPTSSFLSPVRLLASICWQFVFDGLAVWTSSRIQPHGDEGRMTATGDKPATGLFSFILICQKASPFSPRAFHQMLKTRCPNEGDCNYPR